MNLTAFFAGIVGMQSDCGAGERLLVFWDRPMGRSTEWGQLVSVVY